MEGPRPTCPSCGFLPTLDTFQCLQEASKDKVNETKWYPKRLGDNMQKEIKQEGVLPCPDPTTTQTHAQGVKSGHPGRAGIPLTQGRNFLLELSEDR